MRLTALALLSASTGQAEDDARKKAREELERQLQQLVGSNPARLNLELAALDDPNIKLEEASFTLDGKPLATPGVAELGADGTHPVFRGEVKPGKHTLGVKIVYASTVSAMLAEEGGSKWNLGGTLAWDFQPGIEIHVVLTAVRDDAAKAIKDKVKLKSSAQPVMLAKVDDGKMPEPPPKPKVEPVDAGPTAAELAEGARLAAEQEKKRKAEEAEATRLAAEQEKKRKAEEAEEARRAAVEEKKQKAEAAKLAAAEAKRAAAEEKKRKAEEAATAKLAAADEKKRKAEEAEEAKKPKADEEAKPPKQAEATPPQSGSGSSAGAAAAPGDGGTAVAAGSAGSDSSEPMEIPWLFVGAGALVVAGISLLVIAKRRANPRLD